jgi:hypothetical protein
LRSSEFKFIRRIYTIQSIDWKNDASPDIRCLKPRVMEIPQ